MKFQKQGKFSVCFFFLFVWEQLVVIHRIYAVVHKRYTWQTTEGDGEIEKRNGQKETIDTLREDGDDDEYER